MPTDNKICQLLKVMKISVEQTNDKLIHMLLYKYKKRYIDFKETKVMNLKLIY